MNKIYLVSYNGGAGGEFLCYQISKDPEYYDANLRYVTDSNQWVLDTEFNGLKNNLDNLTKHDADAFMNRYKEKNITIPTHYCESLKIAKQLIPNLAGIRFYFSYKMFPLFYSLMWIKGWTNKIEIKSEKPIDRLNSLINTLYDPRESYVSNFAWSKSYNFKEHIPKIDNMDNCLKAIIEKGYFYSFEAGALANHLKHSKDYFDFSIPRYLDVAMTQWPEYTMLNVEKLLTQPKDNVGDWQRTFDMSAPMDYREIEQYHQTNLALIEKTFNKPYEEFSKGAWIHELKEWIKIACPDPIY